jgi:hypothetical protein
MADYIVYVHGVANRDKEATFRSYSCLHHSIEKKSNCSDIRWVPLFWGDIALAAEEAVNKGMQRNPCWVQMKMTEFRNNNLFPFVEDAAVYLNLAIGQQIIKSLIAQAKKYLPLTPAGGFNLSNDDRIHFVTHSWGTVILFDFLFSERWTGDPDVDQLRGFIFGMAPQAAQGAHVASMTTMGSPIAPLSLLFDNKRVPPSTSIYATMPPDLLANFRAMRTFLGANNHKPIAWTNWINPADVIAYPLAQLIDSWFNLPVPPAGPPAAAAPPANPFRVRDFLVENGFWQNIGAAIENHNPWELIANYHGCYWKSEEIADNIAKKVEVRK